MEYRNHIITQLSSVLSDYVSAMQLDDIYTIIFLQGKVIGIRDTIFILQNKDKALYDLCDSIISILERKIKQLQKELSDD